MDTQKFLRKNITLRSVQDMYIKRKSINLSRFVQSAIDREIQKYIHQDDNGISDEEKQFKDRLRGIYNE